MSRQFFDSFIVLFFRYPHVGDTILDLEDTPTMPTCQGSLDDVMRVEDLPEHGQKVHVILDALGKLRGEVWELFTNHGVKCRIIDAKYELPDDIQVEVRLIVFGVVLDLKVEPVTGRTALRDWACEGG